MLVSTESLHQILRMLYTDMMSLCSNMTSVASGIAGIGALLYISYRVWQSLARGEAIDLFPLLRPFAIGICILFFPTLVLGGLNGILSPVVKATHSLMLGQTFDMQRYAEQKQQQEREDRENMPADSHFEKDTEMEQELDGLNLDEQTQNTLDQMNEEHSSWSFKGWIMKGITYLLELLFAGVAIVIDVLRTFYLVVLSILGPLAFAFSVFDGFQSTLTNWLSKYISIYLWLPISDLFSAIIARLQVLTMRSDMACGYDGSTAIYLIFMIIAICGFFNIPTIATWIVQTGGMSGYNKSISKMASLAAGYAAKGGWAGTKAGGKAVWSGVKWAANKLRGTRQ